MGNESGGLLERIRLFMSGGCWERRNSGLLCFGKMCSISSFKELSSAFKRVVLQLQKRGREGLYQLISQCMSVNLGVFVNCV